MEANSAGTGVDHKGRVIVFEREDGTLAITSPNFNSRLYVGDVVAMMPTGEMVDMKGRTIERVISPERLKDLIDRGLVESDDMLLDRVVARNIADANITNSKNITRIVHMPASDLPQSEGARLFRAAWRLTDHGVGIDLNVAKDVAVGILKKQKAVHIQQIAQKNQVAIVLKDDAAREKCEQAAQLISRLSIAVDQINDVGTLHAALTQATALLQETAAAV